jgi:TolB-like protein
MRTLLITLALAAAADASAAGRQKIAVTDVRSIQGVAQGTATILSEVIATEVARLGFDVISQADINVMIGFEKQKQMLGCSEDSSCLAEIGGALGVDYVVAGQVGQLGSRYRFSLLLVDARKSKVVGRAAQFCDATEDALAKVAEQTIEQILASIRSPGAAPPPVAARPSGPAAAASGTPAKSAPSGAGASGAPVAAKGSEPPAAVAAATGPEPAKSPSAWDRHWPAWVTMGSGGLLLVGGVVSGVMAKSALNDLKAAEGNYRYANDFTSRSDRVHRFALTADVLYGTGAVAVGVGGWLWWRGASATEPAVSVVPTVGTGAVGVSAAGRF